MEIQASQNEFSNVSSFLLVKETLIYYLMCMGILPAYVCVPRDCLVPAEARAGHRLS